MEIWKEFEANELTHSAAHHLAAIHEVGRNYGGWARVSDVARQLGITRGSVSINLRTLKKRGLVLTDQHHLVKLSEEGQKIVLRVMVKKTVFKDFLIRVLGLSEDQAEIDSCKIEHLISQSTGERLVQFVRFLMSEQALAGPLLVRFQKYQAECEPAGTCPTDV